MQKNKMIQALMGIGLISVLAACGGGSGSSTSSPSGSTSGTVNIAITDGPSDTFNHVWVTVTAIAFHTDPNALWSASDATWQKTTLTTPMTIDLAALNNGAMNNVFANMKLPNGSYKQIRFFLAGDNDALTSSAQAISDNEATPTPLKWNDQVEYVNANSVVAEAPLEIAYPTQGIQLQGTFTVTAGATLNLATDFDLDKIVVPFRHGAMQSFTLKPDLGYFDLSNSGGISGTVATTNLCATSTTTKPAASCAFNLIVHAEKVSADGTRYEDVRSTSVNPVDGTFTLAPLPIVDSSNSPISYDIVIRGRQMETMVITGVKPAGTYTNTTLANQTVLSSAAIPLTVVNEYGVQLASALSPLASGHVVFQQTLTQGGLPHEIRWADTNPFTGLLDRAGLASWNQNFWLANAGVNVAPFQTGGSLTFTPVTPVEGNGGYTAAANEVAYYNFGSGVALAPPTGGATSMTFTAAAPTLQTGIQPGTVSGTVALGTLGSYTSGEVVLSRFGHIISTIPLSSFVASSSVPFSFSNVPAGNSTTNVAGAYYYAYVRLDDGNGHHTTVPIAGGIDLRATTSVTGVNVTVSE